MIRLAFLTACCFVVGAHAASLQNPILTTANYTTFYAGGLNMGQNELNGINNNGVAVGEFASTSPKLYPPYSTVYANFQIRPLSGAPDAGGSKVTGINDHNTFVGYGNLPGLPGLSGYLGFYNPATYSPVVPLNFPGAVATYPYAINNQGTVVGAYQNGTDGLQHGFIYRADGSFQTLDNPNFRNTTLVGINNLGQIVGSEASNIFDHPPSTGFLYSSNSFTDLSYGRPVGINDLGAIAITTASGDGVLYPDGTLAIAYASTVFSSDPFMVNGISAINNQGTLIFNSAYAFIATPVASSAPEPSSLSLLTAGGLGFAGLCVWRRRRASLL